MKLGTLGGLAALLGLVLFLIARAGFNSRWPTTDRPERTLSEWGFVRDVGIALMAVGGFLFLLEALGLTGVYRQ